MKPKKPQTFENHRSYDPLAIGIMVLMFLHIAILLFSFLPLLSPEGNMLLLRIVLLDLFVLMVGQAFLTRRYPLAMQDRIIRLEMQLRLKSLLPPDEHWQINGLEKNQIIALRFASDEELPDLMRKVLNEHITNRNAIKRMIKYWTPDYERI